MAQGPWPPCPDMSPWTHPNAWQAHRPHSAPRSPLPNSRQTHLCHQVSYRGWCPWHWAWISASSFPRRERAADPPCGKDPAQDRPLYAAKQSPHRRESWYPDDRGRWLAWGLTLLGGRCWSRRGRGHLKLSRDCCSKALKEKSAWLSRIEDCLHTWCHQRDSLCCFPWFWSELMILRGGLSSIRWCLPREALWNVWHNRVWCSTAKTAVALLTYSNQLKLENQIYENSIDKMSIAVECHLSIYFNEYSLVYLK